MVMIILNFLIFLDISRNLGIVPISLSFLNHFIEFSALSDLNDHIIFKFQLLETSNYPLDFFRENSFQTRALKVQKLEKYI